VPKEEGVEGEESVDGEGPIPFLSEGEEVGSVPLGEGEEERGHGGGRGRAEHVHVLVGGGREGGREGGGEKRMKKKKGATRR
jgi:hypothetical protein